MHAEFSKEDQKKLEALSNWIANKAERDFDAPIRRDPMLMQRINFAAKKALCDLNSKMVAEINIPFCVANEHGGKHFKTDVTSAFINDILEKSGKQKDAYSSQNKREQEYRNQTVAPNKKGEAYYREVLNIKTHSSFVDIKNSYRMLAAQYHPDKVNHLGDKLKNLAEVEFKEINLAFEYFKKKHNQSQGEL